MRNYWIRLGCFLTGHNYGIVQATSEVSAKSVKKYTSAILIVCILWSFVGYTFTDRYLQAGVFGSIIGAIIMVTIIVQIERLIILSISPSKMLIISRGLIALAMAIVGAVIIDQIIFKEDIELEKITFIEERVKKALPPKTDELRRQIMSLDTAIYLKESERSRLVEDVNKNPLIRSTSTQTTPTIVQKTSTDSLGRKTTTEKIVNSMAVSVTNVANPNQSLIGPLQQSIDTLRGHRAEKENALLNVRPEVEKEIKSRKGFLDELEVMYSLITGSGVALGVWLIWFFLLLGLEMLVLISKTNEKRNDYEETVMHQMSIQMKKLEALGKLANRN